MKKKYVFIGVILRNQTWLLVIVNLGLLLHIRHMTREILTFMVQSQSDKEKRERFFEGQNEKCSQFLFQTNNIKFYA
jgi:hypothetical protein